MPQLSDPKRANSILYALQTASQNLRRTRFEPYEEVVTVIEQDVELASPPRRAPAPQAEIERPLPPRPTRPATHDDVTAFLNKLLPAAVKPEPKGDGPRQRAQRVNVGSP